MDTLHTRPKPFAMAAQAAWLAYQATGRPSRLIKANGRWRVINAPPPPPPPTTSK